MKLSRRGPIRSNEWACSFCGKQQAQVAKLIAGPGVYICDACIRVANGILVEEGIPT